MNKLVMKEVNTGIFKRKVLAIVFFPFKIQHKSLRSSHGLAFLILHSDIYCLFSVSLIFNTVMICYQDILNWTEISKLSVIWQIDWIVWLGPVSPARLQAAMSGNPFFTHRTKFHIDPLSPGNVSNSNSVFEYFLTLAGIKMDETKRS